MDLKTRYEQLKEWIHTMKMSIARILFLSVSLLTGIRTIQAEVEQGWNFYKEREYQQAAAQFEKALSSGQEDAAVREGLGWCYYWLGRFDAAEMEFLRALELDPGLVSAAKGLGEVKKWRYLPFNNAWELFYNGDYSSALALFQQILNDQTNRLPVSEFWKVHSGMGWCYYNLNNFPEAEKSFRNILNIYKGNPFALKGLGFTQYRMGHYNDAAETLLLTLEKHPEWTDTLSILGWNYYSQKNYKEALESFNKALEYDADYSDALYGSGWTLTRLDNPREACKMFARGAAITPYHPSIYELFSLIDKNENWWELYAVFGWSYYRQKDYPSAEKTFTAGLKRLPDHADLKRGVGFCNFKSADYPAALETLIHVDEKNTGLEPVTENCAGSDGTEYTIRSNTTSIIAWCRYYGGAIDEAMKLFRKNLETHGDWTDCHTGLAWCALKLGRLSEAETHFKNALNLNPAYSVALEGMQEIKNIRYTDFNKAWNNFYSGKYEEAVTGFRKIIATDLKSINPEDHWQIYSGLGASFLKLNNPREALEAYKHCLKLQCNNPYCLWGRAEALYKLEEYPQALQAISDAINVDGKNAEYHALHGWICYQSKQYGKAEKSFKTALSLHAGNDNALAGLGWLKLRSNKINEARTLFQQSLSINGENSYALEGEKNATSTH